MAPEHISLFLIVYAKITNKIKNYTIELDGGEL